MRLMSWRSAVIAIAAVLVLAGTAMAGFVGLPSDGSQVNNDPANGIDPARDAGASDVVGGALAGGVRVPWATFEQKTAGEQQIFVRAFKNGQWVTQGNPASLNIDPTRRPKGLRSTSPAPTARCRGWRGTSPTPHGRPDADLRQPLQRRAQRLGPRGPGPGARQQGPVAEHQPRPHGGEPGRRRRRGGRRCRPCRGWRGRRTTAARPMRRRTPDLRLQGRQAGQATSRAPASSPPRRHGQPVLLAAGRPRAPGPNASRPSANGDPTLNIDPTRDGVEPDIAFTGPNDTVPWVVWYEKDASASGLRDNEQVFAAKVVADATADGGFHWQAVGNGTAGQTNVLDLRRTHGFGACAASTTAEDACSLNAVAARDAEDPRVAAGTLTPGAPTVPWVVWSEDTGSGNARDLRLAARRRRPLRARQRRPAGVEPGQRRERAGHHVLRQHAVHVLAGETSTATCVASTATSRAARRAAFFSSTRRTAS